MYKSIKMMNEYKIIKMTCENLIMLVTWASVCIKHALIVNLRIFIRGIIRLTLEIIRII